MTTTHPSPGGPAGPPLPPGPGGDLTDELRSTPVWTDDMVTGAGIPVVDVPFVAVGGGLGSFCMVDHLRIAGAPLEALRVLGLTDHPWEHYRYLAAVSQIPDHERLRSDSASTPDNIWGFPSYALREAWEDRTLAPIWQVMTEPILADYYTPRAGQVYRAVHREALRIGWYRIVNKGQVRMVRRRAGGGYFVLLTPPPGSGAARRVAFRCRFAHIALGYPGVRFLPDLQEYRQRHRDFQRVVNAYEPHDHVYQRLVGRPGTVLVRGSGIVASRVLQRLGDDIEQHGARTTVWHLFRNYVAGPHGPPRFRRDGGDGFAYQAFNFPKAAWGGQLRYALERLDGEERARLIRAMGGTNTPKRRSWQAQLQRGREAGWYRTHVGEVTEVVPTDDGRILTRIRSGDGATFEIVADYIIDATGLDGEVRDNRVLADLLDHGGAQLNPLGRLEVDKDTFELVGTRNEPGRLYGAGSMTLGGPYAPVDSFLGLQYAALRATDDLARLGFVRRIGVWRSITQWWRWTRNREP